MYISQDPIGLKSRETNFYSYVQNSTLSIDPFGLSELVYQLVENGKVVYYGITERTALERANEHKRSGKQFSHMEVIAENLTHDQARSLEGALIRDRLEDRIGDYADTDSVEEKLRKSGLQNKNRGRVVDRWNPKNPLKDVPRLEKPRKVVPTCK